SEYLLLFYLIHIISIKAPHAYFFSCPFSYILFFVLYMGEKISSVVSAIPSKADPTVLDLDRDYIQDYLVNVRHRSPQTIDLYRRSIAACKLQTVKKDEIDEV